MSTDFDKARYIKEINNPFDPVVLKEINTEVKLPLSDAQLDKFFGSYSNYNDHVLKFSELKEFKDLDDLFSNKGNGKGKKFFGYKIILLELGGPNSGHWITLLKYKKGNKFIYEYFDSYGKVPEYLLSTNTDEQNKELGSGTHFIKILLQNKARDKNVDVIYNKFPFQKENPQVNTCGRHAILRILTADHFNYSLDQYGDFLIHLRDGKYKGLDFDQIVTLLVDISFDF